jgi:hypothetical protein
VADVIHNVTAMVELQARLFLADGKATIKRALLAIALWALGISILIGCIPVGLLATTELLVVRAGLTRSWALGLSAGAGFALAVALVVVASLLLRTSAAALQPSREELGRNLEWIKYILKTRGSTARDLGNHQHSRSTGGSTHESR